MLKRIQVQSVSILQDNHLVAKRKWECSSREGRTRDSRCKIVWSVRVAECLRRHMCVACVVCISLWTLEAVYP